jgi:restriction system protein
MKEATVWGIHAGRTGDAESLFFNKNVIAIGWQDMGDLSKLKSNREAFKEAAIQAYPDKKPSAIPNVAGQPFRFMHEIQIDDIVIYPSKKERKVYIGKIKSNYMYDQSYEKSYPHRRSVKWIKSFPRTHFTQGALYEIGSAMSLFQVKNFVDEFLSALEGKTEIESVAKDETVKFVVEDIEETTRDFILKSLSQELKGHPLASLVAHLLNTMGYKTRISPEGPDGGIDIVAHRDELGFEPPIIKVQVKSSEGNVGDPIVSALYGKVDPNEHGLLVALGSFTKQAVNFAREKTNLRLIDGEELVNLILTHYEQFDSRYKGLLPLKKVYVPESINEE